MATKQKSRKSKKGGEISEGGLSVQTFGGLNKSRYTKGTGGDRIVMKTGGTVTVQFVAPINDKTYWKEIQQHQFQDGGRWQYVPCLGKNCPLCDDEDDEVRKTTYRFFTLAYDFKEKRIGVLEGPKDLSGRIAFRYEKKKKRFLDMTWDISKFNTTPVSYDVESGDEDPVRIKTDKLIDLKAYIDGQARRYFGDDMPTGKKKGRTALDDDDDDDAEDGEYDEDELDDMTTKEIKKIAKGMGIKTINPKTDEPRSKATLIRLILKKQG